MDRAATWVIVRMYLTSERSNLPAAICSEMFSQHKGLHIFYKCRININPGITLFSHQFCFNSL